MRILLIFLLIFAVHSSIAQNVAWQPFNIDSTLADTLFTKSDSFYNPMTLVFVDDNGVTHYDNVPDSNKYEVTSNILIKGHWSPTILFTKAYWEDSILCITMSEGTPAESKMVEIRILGDQYKMWFEYQTPMSVYEEISKTNSSALGLKFGIDEETEVIYAISGSIQQSSIL